MNGLPLKVAGLAIALAACNAIAGLDGDFRVDGGSAGEAPEAGPSTSSSSGTSASSSSSSGSTVDSGHDASDATVDASPAVDSGHDANAPPVCAPGTFFCDDFETGNYPPGPWDGDTITTGSLVASGNAAVTGAFGLRTTMSGDDGSSTRSAFLQKNLGAALDTSGHTVTLDFEFRVVSVDPALTYFVIGALRYGTDRNEYGLAVYRQVAGQTGTCSSGLCFDQADPNTATHAFASTLPVDLEWHHATVTLTRNAGADFGGSVAISIPGQASVDVRAHATGELTANGTGADAVIGAFYAGTNGAAVVDFDDVVLTTN